MTTKRFQLILWVITLIIVVGSCIVRFSPVINNHSEEKVNDFTNKSVSEINIDADVADLNIEYGDDFIVTSNYQKNIEPSVTLENGVLKIQQKNSINVRNIKDCYIKVVLPEGTKIDTANITTSAGDIDIDGIYFDELKIDADAGDIDINNVHANSFVLDADAGDIDIEKCELETVKVTADAGSVDLKQVTGKTASFDTDMGSIKVDVDFEKITASCELGDIDITVPDTNKVDFDLDCELGSIKVNGSNWKN